jgi:hypothetical protein
MTEAETLKPPNPKARSKKEKATRGKTMDDDRHGNELIL